jgi:hypothetical protein
VRLPKVVADRRKVEAVAVVVAAAAAAAEAVVDVVAIVASSRFVKLKNFPPGDQHDLVAGRFS